MVKDLVSMGFDEARANRALRNFRNNMNLVTDHLLSTTEDMDDQVFGPANQPPM
jgi:uncharacterized UBP type Zn finger protein